MGAALDPHRTRAAITQTRIGLVFTAIFGSLYAVCGSPWSGAAIGLVFLGLLGVPVAIRRRVPIERIGNVLIACTWAATFLVVSRTGGVASPAVVWPFLFPLASYAVCGARSALVWAFLAALQLVAFFLAELLRVPLAQDLGPTVLAVLRVSGYAGVIATIILLLSVLERARQSAFDVIDAENRARERARILDDMHDGVGSQLLGLLVQLRTGRVETSRIVASIETCIDDLRLIIAALDLAEPNLEQSLGELRARVEPRFAAAGIELRWKVEASAARPDATAQLQCVRAMQEMLTNALRHSESPRIDVEVGLAEDHATSFLELVVRDHGKGLVSAAASRTGRGLASLAARARRLGGTFEIQDAAPGVLARFRVPVARGGLEGVAFRQPSPVSQAVSPAGD